jgi:hypothetical protein
VLALVAAAAATSPPFDPLAPPTPAELHGHTFVAHHPSAKTAAPKTTTHHAPADTPQVSALKQRVAKLESMVAEHPRGPPPAFLAQLFGPPPSTHVEHPRGPPPAFLAQLFGPPPSTHVSPHGWHNGRPHGELWRKIAHRFGGKTMSRAFTFEVAVESPHGEHHAWHHAWHRAWHHGCHRHHHIFMLVLILLSVGCCCRCCRKRRHRKASAQTMQEMESQMQQDERMAFELQQMESQQMGVTTYAPAAPAAPMQVVVPSPSDYVTPGVAVPMADDDFQGIPKGFIVGTPVHLTTQ